MKILICILGSLNLYAQLDQYQWKNRLLLLNVEAVEQAAWQEEIFNKAKKSNDERDLILIKVKKENQKLWKKYDFDSGIFKMHLIGKDGGLKETYIKPVSMESVYTIIDKMPMRIQEMRQDK